MKTVCKEIEVTEQTYYRWRKEYGGLKVDQAKRLRELEKENSRLKKLVADQALDNAILKEVAALPSIGTLSNRSRVSPKTSLTKSTSCPSGVIWNPFTSRKPSSAECNRTGAVDPSSGALNSSKT